MGFLENEMVKVFHIVDDSWWQGSLLRNGAEGMFPKDFVSPVLNPNTPQMTPNGKQTASPNKLAPGTPSKEFRVSKGTPNTSFANNSFANNSYANNSVANNSLSHAAGGNLFNGSYKHLPVLRSAPVLNEYDTLYEEADTSYTRSRTRENKPLQLYSQYVLSSGLTKAKTCESLPEAKRLSMISPDNSPVRMRNEDLRDFRDLRDLRNDKTNELRTPRDDFIQLISLKRQQLEMELQALKQLERSHRQTMPKLVDSSFVSEDLLLSLRNFVSQDELGHKLDADGLDEVPGPPPPPKHKTVPFDADDFRVSGASYSERPLYTEDLKASYKSMQSDVLNLSELSATSAGSFMRHKYEKDLLDFRKEMADNEMRMSKMNVDGEDVMDQLFKEKKPKTNIFKMLRKKKPAEQNLMEQRLQKEPDNWQKLKVELNRMNTLPLLDKQARTRRAAKTEPNFIIKPLEYVTDINVSETFGPDDLPTESYDLRVNVRKVSEFSEKYEHTSDFNDLISDISVKFGSWKPNEIRAALLHLCKFRIIEEHEKISQTKPKLHEVMAKGEATIFQLNYLFKKFLAALGIPSEVVLGFWKKPNEFYHSDQLSVNHCWLSVMIEADEQGNGCFRLIDLMCFQNGSICNKKGFNEHFFMAEPLDWVSTHIPSVIELQHVTPPIDLNIAFHLPRIYSGFKKNRLDFVNFNNALTRMNDLEFFEADIIIPTDVELFTLIKTLRSTLNDFTLCQVYWSGQKRIAKIKAILPDEHIGVLQIFAGPKGAQTHFDNIHELACVVPLYHTGTAKPTKFVPRYPTIQSQNNDLYIKHPQLSTISAQNAYNFEIEVHPLMGLGPSSGLMNQDFRLVIESPLGKYTKLINEEPSKPMGCFSANITCHEKGLYRALVIGDSGNSWYVFAQWESA